MVLKQEFGCMVSRPEFTVLGAAQHGQAVSILVANRHEPQCAAGVLHYSLEFCHALALLCTPTWGVKQKSYENSTTLFQTLVKSKFYGNSTTSDVVTWGPDYCNPFPWVTPTRLLCKNLCGHTGCPGKDSFFCFVFIIMRLWFCLLYSCCTVWDLWQLFPEFFQVMFALTKTGCDLTWNANGTKSCRFMAPSLHNFGLILITSKPTQ